MGNFRQLKFKVQKGTELLLPKAPFERFLCEIVKDLEFDIRFKGRTIEALQIVVEDQITRRLASAKRVAINAKRSTSMVKDMDVVKDITEN
eukprot:IDg2079t1